MFTVNESKDCIDFKFSSEMKLVDRVANEVGAFLAEDGQGDFSGFRTVLRELLINAVEHGNGKVSALTVRCAVQHCCESLYKICVEDEGAGFDWSKIDRSLPAGPGGTRKRGLPLVNTFADKLEFNEKGNAVTAWITINKGTGYSVTNEDGVSVITPSGDITAASSDSLRELLDGLFKAGLVKCRFDLKHVKDIDSVGLSSLIILSKMLEEKWGGRPQLEIANAADDIIRLFQMTMLDTIYRLMPQAGQDLKHANGEENP